jgi:hypothetical protein
MLQYYSISEGKPKAKKLFKLKIIEIDELLAV